MARPPGRSPLIRSIVEPTGNAGHLHRFVCLITRHFNFERIEVQQAPSTVVINMLLSLCGTFYQMYERASSAEAVKQSCASHRPLYTSGTRSIPVHATSWILFNGLKDAENTISAKCLLLVTMC